MFFEKRKKLQLNTFLKTSVIAYQKLYHLRPGGIFCLYRNSFQFINCATPKGTGTHTYCKITECSNGKNTGPKTKTTKMLLCKKL